MSSPIQLVSTDFDGTIYAEFDGTPVPVVLQSMLGSLQEEGVKWIINTGRDMSGVMDGLSRSKLSIKPDFIVTVEREIHVHKDGRFIGLDDWNYNCYHAHQGVFSRLQRDLPRLRDWVNKRFSATVYEDPYSPFCLMAENSQDTDNITAYLDEYCKEVPGLTVVRNDVYARFSHKDFNKGTALGEITRILNLTPACVFAAGDHLNDLTMLSTHYARCLAAPVNAVPEVKALVRKQGGYVSGLPCGLGTAEGLAHYLQLGS